MSKAVALSPRQINRCFALIELMQDKETKAAAFSLSHAAMRVSEIARLEVKNILYQSGEIRSEIHLPASICKGLKTRTVWLTNPKSRQAIQNLIDYRISRKWGLSIDRDQYQGLEPESKLLYNNRGRAYSLSNKPRKMLDGSVKDYKACDALEDLFRRTYKKLGYKDASSHSGRKSLVSNAILKGTATLEQCSRMLGHDEEQTTLHYVQINRNKLSSIFDMAQEEILSDIRI